MRRFSFALLAAISTIALTQVASAADLPVKAPRAPIMAPLYNWTGFYAGLNIGYSWGNQTNSLVSGGGTLFSNSDRINGIIGGGQIGYNWQFNQIVLGVEADFQGSGQQGDGLFGIAGTPASNPCLPVASCPIPATPATAITYTDKLDWFGTVRGRLGFAMDRWLPYVTAGWAYGHGTINGSSTGAITTTFSGSNTYSGWTVGGGVEWAFMDHWSAKAEYLYIDFGDGPTTTLTPTVNIVSGRMTDNIVRVGVNYKF